MATSTSRRETNEYDVFPAKQLASLALCRLAEPVAFISIISYNFAMVREIKGPENTAFYAGLLVSAFGIAEASTAMIWGSLSDRYGRKPIIIIGLTGTAASSLLLGFARHYWVAILARIMGGLLNGNIAVMQTMVAEIVKNPKHEPRAYAVQPFMWSLGSIAGSALGGYAAQPARFYPQYFAQDGIFAKFPYLLPNLVAVIAIVLAIIQAAIFMKETNSRVIGSTENGDYTVPENADSEGISETTPLQKDQKPRTRRLSYVVGSMPTDTDEVFDVRRASIASIRSYKTESRPNAVEIAAEDEIEDTASETSTLTAEPIFNKAVVMWTIAIALMCYQQMAFMSVFPTYLLDTPHRTHALDLTGGLGFSVHDVGRYMAVNSGVSLVIQGFLFPFIVARLGVWKSIVSLTLFSPFVSIAMPFLTTLPRRDIAIYPLFALQALCTIIVYPSLLIMLKNATTSRSHLGKVNGLATSASSAIRTVAPPFIGILYSRFGSACAWWSCAVAAMVALAELYFVPRPKREEKATLRTESAVENVDVEQ